MSSVLEVSHHQCAGSASCRQSGIRGHGLRRHHDHAGLAEGAFGDENRSHAGWESGGIVLEQSQNLDAKAQRTQSDAKKFDKNLNAETQSTQTDAEKTRLGGGRQELFRPSGQFDVYAMENLLVAIDVFSEMGGFNDQVQKAKHDAS